MPSEFLTQFTIHLRLLGYQLSPLEGKHGVLGVTHLTKNSFFLKESYEVCRFVTYFKAKKSEKVPTLGYLGLINSLNRAAAVVRFCNDEEKTPACQALFHGAYNHSRFGFFVELWEHDMEFQENEKYPEICKYLE